MTVLRITGAGIRRRTGSGHIRALGQSGPASADVAAAAGTTTFTLTATLRAATLINIAAAPAASAFSASAAPRARAHTRTAPAALAFSLSAAALGRLSLPPAHAPTTFTLAPASISSSRIAALPPAHLALTFSATAAIATNTGQHWRSLWQAVYAARQTVLNAIDANNRLLAQTAGSTAQAAADAVVATNTRVDDLDDALTAEAARTTALTARVSNAEGNLSALGTSLFSMGARVTSAENTLGNHGPRLQTAESALTSQSWQLQQVQSSLGSKANASAVSALQTEVNALGAAKAQWTLSLNVNGHVSGIHSINTGTTSEFTIASSVFRVLAPANADSGMEIKDGTLRTWRGSSQRIIGNGFGQGGQLMDWFGPNVGTANASKTNAVMWMDTDGNAEFNGKITAHNIVGKFQSAVAIQYTGPSANINGATFTRFHHVTLPAPQAAGEEHIPVISITLRLTGKARGLRVRIVELLHPPEGWNIIGEWEGAEVEGDTAWATVFNDTASMPPHTHVRNPNDWQTPPHLNQTGQATLPSFFSQPHMHAVQTRVWNNVISLTAVGTPTGAARQFRITARADTNASVESVNGFAFGIR